MLLHVTLFYDMAPFGTLLETKKDRWKFILLYPPQAVVHFGNWTADTTDEVQKAAQVERQQTRRSEIWRDNDNYKAARDVNLRMPKQAALHM